MLEPAEPYAAYCSIRQSYDHYHGRRVDIWEGGEGLVCVWFIWEDCKCEYGAFARKASADATLEGQSPSPTIFPAY